MGGSRLDRVALAALSAVLLAWPVHREAEWPLGAVFLIPLFVATRGAGWIEAAGLGAFAGVLYGISISLWISEALAELGSSRLASLAGLVLVSLWGMPPVFGVLALASRATAAWCIGSRALALAVVVFAMETWVERVWWGVPTGLLGVSQRGALGVAQLAVAGGVPLISALLVALNVACADVLRGRKRAAPLAVALGAGWLSLALAGLSLAEWVRPSRGSAPSVDFAIAQPNLPRSERWGEEFQPLNLYRVREFTRHARSQEQVDAWILPENLLTTPLDTSSELASGVTAWVDELNAPVLTGLVLSAQPSVRGRYRDSVVWLEPGRGITARIDKERAIPLLESARRFPGDILLAPLFGAAAAWPKVEESPPPGPLLGPVAVAPVLCYEVLFPGIVAGRRTPESVAIVNLADDSWLPGDEASRQLLQLARFRAIEQRLPLVRVAHGGLSGVVDEFGRVVETLPLDTYATRRVSLRALPPPGWQERVAVLALPIAAWVLTRQCFRAVMSRVSFAASTRARVMGFTDAGS